MKVSLNEVVTPTGVNYYGRLGVITRLSSDGKCYSALYEEHKMSEEEVYYFIGIYAPDPESYTALTSMEVYGPVHRISIIATGNDPVHISAWFDGYHLTYDDYTYKLTGEYGGIYGFGSMQWQFYLDEFTEDSVPDNIQSTSLGRIKSLMAD